MLSRRMGAWTRVLVDVEDYRGRRERQLGEIARRAAERVIESGTMLQLEPMPALERRWIHLALRDVAGRRHPVHRRRADAPGGGPAHRGLTGRGHRPRSFATPLQGADGPLTGLAGGSRSAMLASKGEAPPRPDDRRVRSR